MLANTMTAKQAVELRTVQNILRYSLLCGLTYHTSGLLLGNLAYKQALLGGASIRGWLSVVLLANCIGIFSLVYDAIVYNNWDRKVHPVGYWIAEKFRVCSYFFMGAVWFTLGYKTYTLQGFALIHLAVIAFMLMITGLILIHAFKARYILGVHCGKTIR